MESLTIYDKIGIYGIGLVFVVSMILFLIDVHKQNLCKHNEGIYHIDETDVVCMKCGKNLGPDDEWRKRRRKR